MKSLSDILGNTQMLLGINFNPEQLFEENLSTEHRTILSMLRVIEEFIEIPEKESGLRGRPSVPDSPVFRFFLCKNILQIDTNSRMRQRLFADANLKKICGFKKIPSESTFSRRMSKFSRLHYSEAAISAMVTKYLAGHIIRSVSRDSTSIKGREKPHNKKRDIKPKVKKKRGRPRKGEIRPAKEKKRIEKHYKMKPGKAFKGIEKECAWGCKKNSQANTMYWKGYKLHLDTTDIGIPVSALVSGANVHDSQVSIIMEKMTEKRITHLYTMADSAYDVPSLRDYIIKKGRIPVIDFNKRRRKNPPSFAPIEKEQYKTRSVVERANAHLKDYLLPQNIFVKGYKKVNFSLMNGVLCLAAIKVIQHLVLPDC
ncbi:MAG: transposase [Desulfobacterales bacterium]|nr:transposase [Desulfobacterales bacterium]